MTAAASFYRAARVGIHVIETGELVQKYSVIIDRLRAAISAPHINQGPAIAQAAEALQKLLAADLSDLLPKDAEAWTILSLSRVLGPLAARAFDLAFFQNLGNSEATAQALSTLKGDTETVFLFCTRVVEATTALMGSKVPADAEALRIVFTAEASARNLRELAEGAHSTFSTRADSSTTCLGPTARQTRS